MLSTNLVECLEHRNCSCVYRIWEDILFMPQNTAYWILVCIDHNNSQLPSRKRPYSFTGVQSSLWSVFHLPLAVSLVYISIIWQYWTIQYWTVCTFSHGICPWYLICTCPWVCLDWLSTLNSHLHHLHPL